MNNRLFKALRINIFFTALSRFVGLFRQIIISSSLGLSAWADAYQIGFRLANLFRMLLGEGALGAAFIPVYTHLLVDGKEQEADRCFKVVFNYLFLILLFLVALGVAFPGFFVDLTASGLVPETREKAIWMTRLMFPYLLFVGLAGLLMAALNSHRHFTVTAAQPVIWNLAIIGSAFLPFKWEMAEKLAFGVVVGGLLQFLVQIPVLSKYKVRLGFSFDPRFPAFNQVMVLLGPVVFSATLARINTIVDQRFASTLAVGSIAALGYAFLLLQTPLGVFGVSVATAFFPNLSELAQKQNFAAFFSGLRKAILIVSWLAIPSTLFLISFGDSLIELLFQHSNFSAANTQVTTGVLSAYLLGLLPLSLIHILNRSFYSMKDAKTTLKIGFVMVFLNYLCDYLLVSGWGLNGLAAATAVIAWVNLLLLWVVLCKKCGATTLDREIGMEWLKIGISSLAMVFVANYVKMPILKGALYLLPEKVLLFSPVKIKALFQLLSVATVSALIFMSLSHFLGLKGYRALVQKKND